MPATPCPCGSGRDYAHCCGPCHTGTPAATAEALMRSRYSAFVRQDAPYLLASRHPDTRPATLDFNEDPAPKWLGLKIITSQNTDPDTATVEFIARYRVGGRASRLHEVSRFLRLEGRWVYVDGEVEGDG